MRWREATGREEQARGWLRVARCPRLPVRLAAPVVERAGGAARLASPDRRALRARGFPPRLAARLCDGELDRALDRELDRLRALGAELLHPDHPRYPWPVASLSVPPPVLAALGDLEALRPTAVAIVGSRKPSGYGVAMARRLARSLAAAGLTIASGLARGIDGEAHAGALDAGGRTVAVLGTGIDRVYPAEHRRLARRIRERGLLLSEFPPGAPPLKGHFPRRNRIIAGLALAVVVVEAQRRSGSLITACWALEEGRDVLAVPGRAGEPVAEGTVDLLREGAAVAAEPEDVLWALPPSLRPAAIPPPAAGAPGPAPDDLFGRAAPEAGRLLAAFPPYDEVTLEGLIGDTGLPAEELLAGLFALEIGGFIEALPGGRYRRRGTAGEGGGAERPI